MSATKPHRLERVRYYPRQLMTAEDMQAEQDYFLERMRRHNRLLHGWGIVCGLEVKPYATTDKPWQVKVCPGSAYAATGDEINVPCEVPFDLARPPETEEGDCIPCPCPPGPPLGAQPAAVAPYYLAIRYLYRPVRPVRTGSNTNSGCGEEGCETSRLRDDFELALLTKLEGPYAAEWAVAEEEWLRTLRGELADATSLFGLLTRPCWPPTEYPWIILATLQSVNLSLPPLSVDSQSPNVRLASALESAGKHRRPLLQVQDLLAVQLVPNP